MTNRFTEQQKAFILDAINKHKSTIECKKNNLITNWNKNKAWNSIAEAYNAEYSENITSKTLNQLYRKWKSLARKEVADSKQHRNATGGGPPIPPNYTVTTSTILNLDDNILLTIPNAFDNDAEINGDEENSAPVAQTSSSTKSVNPRASKKEHILLLEHEKRMEVLEVQRQTYLKQQAAFDAMREAEDAKKTYYQWLTSSACAYNPPYSTTQSSQWQWQQ